MKTFKIEDIEKCMHFSISQKSKLAKNFVFCTIETEGFDAPNTPCSRAPKIPWIFERFLMILMPQKQSMQISDSLPRSEACKTMLRKHRNQSLQISDLRSEIRDFEKFRKFLRVLVILGHPTKGSFNHAIAETAASKLRENGHEVIYHDLYAEKFDPILFGREIPKNAELDPLIEKHCEEISEADGIIIAHPNWWGQPPAILKGYIDRVIRAGVAYEFLDADNGEGVPNGLLKAETALVFNTTNTPEEREQEVFGDPLENIWKNCIFDLCGVKNFHRKMYGVIVTSNQKERQLWLEDVKKTVDKYFPPVMK